MRVSKDARIKDAGSAGQERACRTSVTRIAEMLRAHPKVARVYYPGLSENKGHASGAAADERFLG